MGRAKIVMEFIKNAKARKIAFENRKKGLKKKAYELATLCGVPVCVVIYPGPNSEPDTYPSDHAEVRSVIDRYVSIEENAKRNFGFQEGVLGNETREERDSFEGNYPNLFPNLDGFSREELVKLIDDLDEKLNAVQERIGDLSGNFAVYDADLGMEWPMSGCSRMNWEFESQFWDLQC